MLHLKPLSGVQDLASLQRVLQQAPRYAQIATAEPVSPRAAEEMLATLPPGKDHEDKFALGVFEDDTLVGCIDLIRGYPAPSVAFVGLLLIAEPYEGRGIGRASFEKVHDIVAGWRSCTRFRLGILKTNEGALRFWHSLGFVPTGESKPYESGSVRTDVLLYELQLAVV